MILLLENDSILQVGRWTVATAQDQVVPEVVIVDLEVEVVDQVTVRRNEGDQVVHIVSSASTGDTNLISPNRSGETDREDFDDANSVPERRDLIRRYLLLMVLRDDIA